MGTGKKRPSVSINTRSEKHPRGDGEEPGDIPCISGGVETPPWGRGRRNDINNPLQKRRNTPVGTGKKFSSLSHFTYSQKHPRGDGEEKRKSAFLDFILETPPWGRGRTVTQKSLTVTNRNTPVGTGKKRNMSFYQFRDEKHPRGDGEEG